MKKIILLFATLIIVIMTSCSGSTDTYDSSGSSPKSVTTNDPIDTAIPSESIASEEFSKPGYAVEADGYTFITDFKSVYRMENKTGETIKIFSSDDDILCIMEYSGYLFVQFYVDVVYRMNFNGNDIRQFKDMDIIIGADGYIYYDNGGGDISRRTVLGDKDEFVSKWFDETNGTNDIGFWSNKIGYYKGKVFFQENHKIYTLSKDGVKTYYCDGDYHSMKGSIIILKKDEEFYSKDIDTGYEFKVYSYEGLHEYEEYISGEFVGRYKENEYYIMNGKILSINSDKITGLENLTFEYVEYATISNEWMYIYSIAENPEFCRYNLLTRQKEPIAAFPTMTPIKLITECNNHLYYVDDGENGLFQIDLDTNICKQIYSGTMFIYHQYV